MRTNLQQRADLAADALMTGVLAGHGGADDADRFFLGLLDLASACAPLLAGSHKERQRAAKRLYQLAQKGGLQHVATN